MTQITHHTMSLSHGEIISNRTPMSLKARQDLVTIRMELRKANPDPSRVNYFLNGNKYNKDINGTR